MEAIYQSNPGAILLRQILLVVCCAFLPFHGEAQKTVDEYAATDKIALQLPAHEAGNTEDIAGYINSHFKTRAEKIRAAFIWTASNISYDVENMYNLNFYEKREEKISKALKSKKGICEHYAAIFNDICLKCGFDAYVIEGYTRQNGVTDYLPHAWNAVYADNAWLLFDPTWGAGYVNGGKFIKKLNNQFYNVAPRVLIQSHMPFDPMWQFLYHPITSQEFNEGKTGEDNTRPYFSYTDSIAAYTKQDEITRLSAAYRRIEGNGVKNALVFDRLIHLRNAIEVYNQNQKIYAHNAAVDEYNAAVGEYNEGVNKLNVFIQYRNKQFTPKKTDAEIQEMVDAADQKLATARNKLNRIKDVDAGDQAMIASLRKSIADAQNHVNEQKDFLTKYFSKGKAGRKSMFYKYTWFGVPLN